MSVAQSVIVMPPGCKMVWAVWKLEDIERFHEEGIQLPEPLDWADELKDLYDEYGSSLFYGHWTVKNDAGDRKA